MDKADREHSTMAPQHCMAEGVREADERLDKFNPYQKYTSWFIKDGHVLANVAVAKQLKTHFHLATVIPP